MNFKEFEDIVVAEFPELTPEMLGKYEAMEALYEEWNAKINVISRKDIGGLYLHHVLHSLAIASYLKRRRPEVYSAWTEGASVLDLGTGGGFPGIPLAVMFPKVRLTLCDSVGKKIIVASEVSKALSLGNVTTVNARASPDLRPSTRQGDSGSTTPRISSPEDSSGSWTTSPPRCR